MIRGLQSKLIWISRTKFGNGWTTAGCCPTCARWGPGLLKNRPEMALKTLLSWLARSPARPVPRIPATCLLGWGSKGACARGACLPVRQNSVCRTHTSLPPAPTRYEESECLFNV